MIFLSFGVQVLLLVELNPGAVATIECCVNAHQQLPVEL
jgi:hypothetical protein